MATNVPVTLDTLIVIKVLYQGHNRKFKVPLRDLGAQVLPDKLRSLLQVHPNDEVVFERYSDSAGAYVTLDADKPQVYKTLFRAAKAKLKLRLKATLLNEEPESSQPALETITEPVQSNDLSSLHRMSSDTLAPRVPEHTVPVIAHSPVPAPPLPTSSNFVDETATIQAVAIEAAQASPVSPLSTHKSDDGEAPVPRSFTARERFFSNLQYPPPPQIPGLAIRPKEAPTVQTSWVVFCNHCNQAMEDEHFHCSICDHGDYDLCQSCVDAGVHCPGIGHWMVKRFVKNGVVVNSVVERIAPKTKPSTEQEMPGAFTDEKQSVEPEEPTRTCNSCVHVLPEKEFVTCSSCEDYDLCVDCHVGNKHGHHPGHAFKPATTETTLPALAQFLCNAGRNVRHSAVCDGCEKFIYGVRHKCLNCPDWDFCSECIKSAKYIHPRHRFVPIYEPLAEPATSVVRHYGIYCDGPLCKDRENSSYIEGIRYKCAVCHDTDFCANCEAIPSNRHNRTHPLIKFKTPVRSVSVTTMGEDKNGLPMARLGDQPARRSTATETAPVAIPTNAATEIQTVVDVKPTTESQPPVEPQPKVQPKEKITEKIAIRDLLAEPVQEKIPSASTPAEPVAPATTEPATSTETEPKTEELDAHFVRDIVPDGTKIGAAWEFIQIWTLRNPGPHAWPEGCSIRHVGGDNMLAVDNTRPLSHEELSRASETNATQRKVEPGEEISFRTKLKAPSREGTAISYWRLKTADGMPFGHRLWCDIQVLPPAGDITIPDPKVKMVPTCDELRKKVSFKNLPPGQSRWDVLHEAQARCINNEVINKPGLTEGDQQKIRQLQKVRGAAIRRIVQSGNRQYARLLGVLTATQFQPLLNVPLPPEFETAELPVSEAAIKREPSVKAEPVSPVVVKAEPSAKEEPQVEAKVESPVEAKGESSGMIFPQLDKESPSSSTHEATSVQPETAQSSSSSATAIAPSVQSEEEFFEDAESVEIRSISSDDEGFMTDEEYDILDASDEEFA